MKTLLFAAVDWGEVIKILVILLVIFGSAIGKLVANMRRPQHPAGPQRPPAQPPQPQAQGPKSVKGEIEAFLRRVTEQKQAGAGNAPRPVAAPAPPTLQASFKAREKQPVAADTLRERPVGGQVSEHVRKYLDEKEFTQRASSLGEEVALADEKIEQHLRDVFEHKIGQLAGKSGEAAVAPAPLRTGVFEDEVPALPAAGVGLALLLNNVTNLRQAIVINEILQRPVDRWE